MNRDTWGKWLGFGCIVVALGLAPIINCYDPTIDSDAYHTEHPGNQSADGSNGAEGSERAGGPEQEESDDGVSEDNPSSGSSCCLPQFRESNDVDCEVWGVPVSVAEWVDAADAVVIGTVSAVYPTRDLAAPPWGSDWPEPVIDISKCRSEPDFGFILELSEFKVLSGEVAPGTVHIRFGSLVQYVLDAGSIPDTTDADLEWPSPDRAIFEGQRIGGAIYAVDISGVSTFYTFGTSGWQPFFGLEDGVVRFQPQRSGAVCFPHLPPVGELDGLSEGEVTLAVEMAGVREPGADGSALRAALGVDNPPDGHAGRWFPYCSPQGWSPGSAVGECDANEQCEELGWGWICGPDGWCIPEEEEPPDPPVD